MTFFDGISLAPADMAKLTHGNADALLKLKVGQDESLVLSENFVGGSASLPKGT